MIVQGVVKSEMLAHLVASTMPETTRKKVRLVSIAMNALPASCMMAGQDTQDVGENIMAKELPEWTKIEKGSRRPDGRVLVSYDYKDLDVETLEWVTRWGVTGAWWNPKRQQWVADHGKPVTKVTHWMPMPTGGKDGN